MNIRALTLLLASAALVACSSTSHLGMTHEQKTGAITGAIFGAMGAALLHPSLALSIVITAAGAGAGYYINTESDDPHFTLAQGTVFKQGQYILISIPNDALFEANSETLLPNASNILNEVVTILSVYSSENVLVTGNTDGMSSPSHEAELSTHQAKAIADFLWNAGIKNNDSSRQLNYSGLANQYPVANTRSEKGLAKNRHIQITVYPTLPAH